MKFAVSFYTRGDLARSTLIAECVVDAIDILTAKTAALAQLAHEHPEVANCPYWHAAAHQPRNLKLKRRFL
jgi:hypothetical protein